MKIENLAQFKRAMKIGTKWNFYDSRFCDKLVERTCIFSQTKSFALDNHPNRRDKKEVSWLDYPQLRELLFIQEQGKPTKVRVNITKDFYLIYEPINTHTKET